MKDITQDIIEGNKLIMEFLGWEEVDSEVYLGYMIPPAELRGTTQPFHPREAKYHTSWDWLMPVVEKIVHAACELPTIELRKEAMKKYDLIQDQLCNFIITGVHFYSVQFIKWYNQSHQ